MKRFIGRSSAGTSHVWMNGKFPQSYILLISFILASRSSRVLLFLAEGRRKFWLCRLHALLSWIEWFIENEWRNDFLQNVRFCLECLDLWSHTTNLVHLLSSPLPLSSASPPTPPLIPKHFQPHASRSSELPKGRLLKFDSLKSAFISSFNAYFYLE